MVAPHRCEKERKGPGGALQGRGQRRHRRRLGIGEVPRFLKIIRTPAGPPGLRPQGEVRASVSGPPHGKTTHGPPAPAAAIGRCSAPRGDQLFGAKHADHGHHIGHGQRPDRPAVVRGVLRGGRALPGQGVIEETHPLGVGPCPSLSRTRSTGAKEGVAIDGEDVGRTATPQGPQRTLRGSRPNRRRHDELVWGRRAARRTWCFCWYVSFSSRGPANGTKTTWVLPAERRPGSSGAKRRVVLHRPCPLRRPRPQWLVEEGRRGRPARPTGTGQVQLRAPGQPGQTAATPAWAVAAEFGRAP